MNFDEAQSVGRALRSIELGDLAGLLAACKDPLLPFHVRSAALAAIEAVINAQQMGEKMLEEDFALRISAVEGKLQDNQMKDVTHGKNERPYQA